MATAAFAVSLAAAGPAVAADWATVILYQAFSDNPADTGAIRLEQFDAHLAELASGGYTVLPLAEVVAALKERRPLPDRAVALTIDGLQIATYRDAWPRLRRAGLPFTLFVATDVLDRGGPGSMSWGQVRELAQAGVGIGHQTTSHPHLTAQTAERVAAELAHANARFTAELGFVPTLFAYPYGEWDGSVRQQIIEAGFAAAFGQQSGVVYGGYDWYTLPRFAMSQGYGSLGRFRLAANALPLRVSEVTPGDPVLQRNPPAFGFTVEPDMPGLDRLACFASSQGEPARIERLGERRIEVRLDQPFPAGRARINCTAPAEHGRWRWFGMQFQVPRSLAAP